MLLLCLSPSLVPLLYSLHSSLSNFICSSVHGSTASSSSARCGSHRFPLNIPLSSCRFPATERLPVPTIMVQEHQSSSAEAAVTKSIFTSQAGPWDSSEGVYFPSDLIEGSGGEITSSTCQELGVGGIIS